MAANLLERDFSLESSVRRKVTALPRFPATRYQGSKRKMLGTLRETFDRITFDSALDLYSGTASVTLLLRLLGKQVTSNDYLLYNQTCARLFQTITRRDLIAPFEQELHWLIHEAPLGGECHVSDRYQGIFFPDQENEQIDRFCQNIGQFSGTKKDLYVYAFGQALLKKRPYNLFHRANLAMRTKDVKRSFGNAVTWETDATQHAVSAVKEFSKFPLDDVSGAARVTGINTLQIAEFPGSFDLVYIDPPYSNARGMGVDYSDFYGFLDGLCDYKLFKHGDESYPHKPINKQPSSWLKAESGLWELEQIVSRFSASTLVISYRNNGLPNLEQIAQLLKNLGRSAEVSSVGGYKYALSQAIDTDECVIVSRV